MINMRITMFSKLLYGAGFIAAIIALIQWYVKFPDVSQLIFGLHLVITLIMCAYLHSWMIEMTQNIKELNEALDRSIEYIRNVDEKVMEK